MSDSKIYGIKTFADLKAEKAKLKSEISTIESDFKSSPVLKIGSAVFGLKIGSAVFGKDKHPDSAFKRPLSFLTKGKDNTLTTGLVHTTENLLGTFLISNKFTRKYFIGYTIAKEMIPFAVKKFNEVFKDKTKYY